MTAARQALVACALTVTGLAVAVRLLWRAIDDLLPGQVTK